MSDQTIALTLEKRDVVGKQVKQLRAQGQVPAVIHNHGKESTHVMAPYQTMYKVFQQAGKHHPVELVVDGKKHLAIIKDAHFEPRKNQLRHVVFNAIRQNQPVTTEVPIVFVGDPEAEKTGLIVLRQLDHLTVEALPKNLPDEVTIDVTHLAEVGDKLHVSDIKIPEGVTLITEPEHALAVVDEPRAHAAAEAEEEATAEETAEGEESTATEEKSDADKPAESETTEK